MSASKPVFTIDSLDWRSWLETVSLEEATPEQTAVLDESHPKARVSDYYRLLVHDPDALRERSRLFNSVMYAGKGLSRAERELASVAVSRINGCAYCASVHAQRFAQLTKDEQTIRRVLDEGVETELDARKRAIVDYSVKLTHTPPTAGPEDVARLREVGLSDLEILDLTHVVAMFAWANRLMQTLGEPVEAKS